MWLFALGLIFLNSLQGLCCKMYAMHYTGDGRNVSYVYCIATGAITAVISLITNGFRYAPSPVTLCVGAAGALMLYGTYHAMIRATAIGSYSFYSVCGCFGGTLIPLLVASVIYGQSFRLSQIAGIAISLLSFVFFYLANAKKENAAKRDRGQLRYFLYCILGAVCVGAYNQIISTQQILLNHTESQEMVITVYLCMALICLIMLLVQNGANAGKALQVNRRAGMYLLACGLILPAYMIALLALFRHFRPEVFYVVGNSGCLIFAAIFSRILFHERFTRAMVAGMLLAVAGAALMEI